MQISGDLCMLKYSSRDEQNFTDFSQSMLVNFCLNLGSLIRINRGFHEGQCVTIAREFADHLEVVRQPVMRR